MVARCTDKDIRDLHSCEVLPQILEERVPHLALGGLRSVVDLGQQLGLNPRASATN